MKFPVRDHLNVLRYKEVQLVIDHLKSLKAAGDSGILPQLLMCGGSEIVEK